VPRLRRGPRTSPGERRRSVKLLLDENLSFRLVAQLEPAFPDSAHGDAFGLHAQADSAICKCARDNSFIILSKYDDLCRLSFFYGPPPILWKAFLVLESPENATQSARHLRSE